MRFTGKAMTSWAIQVRRALDAAAPALPGVVSIHLFGSALAEHNPKDLDLLVVYDPRRVAPQRARCLREVVVQACRAELPLSVDVVLLTKDEAAATAFARSEGAVTVYAAP